MYRYNDFDRTFLRERVLQYRDQVERRLSGALTEEEFKPLRLMNGVYLQLHAYMLRIAIPYGTLSAQQMRGLADIAERWDRGYGHFTTRQNIQFNWPKLVDTPDILEALADLDMHAIQTSGNTIRNVTTDHLAGAALDEIADPRPYAEWIRQWSTDHPEFQFLPRKFKIAISGGVSDRAVIRAHDIGLRLVPGMEGVAFDIYVGGGLGRTPVVGTRVFEQVAVGDLLPHLEAIVSVYNLHGRRDNKYKSRIKIMLREVGLDSFKKEIIDYMKQNKDAFDKTELKVLNEIKDSFKVQVLAPKDGAPYWERIDADPAFREWVVAQRHTSPAGGVRLGHHQPQGPWTGARGRHSFPNARYDLADQFGFSELRVSHQQNIVIPHVALADLPAVFEQLLQQGLATPNIGLISDLIACPGMDYCALATARSIPIGQAIAMRYQSMEQLLGPLNIKISGCINACGHHHVGDIGILGLDKAGVENYQVTLGGRSGLDTALGEKMGPGFSEGELMNALDRLFDRYLMLRESSSETFAETVQRLGTESFKAALYGVEDAA